MRLPEPAERHLVHNRKINCKGFVRADGFFDIEAELKDSKTYDFPCYNFKGFFTFKGDKKYLEYESVGVQPEINLENSEDWIKQTKEYIAKSK